ncbi:MAG: VWA domain-containing protein [Pyrinomonadaceae bacterium]|nr:VWA domain-containing protein [Phycisphaerales bacterium]
MLRFEHPAWLLLTLLALPMAYSAVRWFTSMSKVRRWSAAVLRVLLIALLSGMLAGASSVRKTDRLAVIAVVDVSGSVQRFGNQGDVGASGTTATASAAVMERVRLFLKEASKDRGPDDLLGIVVFDAGAAALLAPTRVDMLDQPIDASMAEGTDIAQALRLGAAMIPPETTGKLLLFSDGVETDGDAVAAAREMTGRRPGARATPAPSSEVAGRELANAPATQLGTIPVDVVPIAYNVRNEVMVESVDAPPQAPEGAVIPLRVILDSAGTASGTLEVVREGRPVDINGDAPGTGRRLTLAPGRHVELVNVQLDHSRMHRFDAVFEPDAPAPSRAGGPVVVNDTIASNNRAQGFTFTPGRGSVLVVDGVDNGSPGGLGQTLPDTLREAGLDVKVVPTDGIPSDLLSLQAYDLIILANVPADATPRQTHAVLAAYVNELGGGLVMTGGRSSFGAGGWKGTDLEAILPVRLDLPEKLISPAAAIVFVMDNSGSMNRTVMGSSRSQQKIANEGAAIAVQTLDKTDLVGVITFNTDYTVDIPLARNSDARASAEIIRSITPDGGTNLPPALEEAHRQLKAATADVKYVIVLTDGRSSGTDALPGMAAALLEDGIHVTTIGVGDQCDVKTLKAMAERGGGESHYVTDPNTLPRVFTKAVRVLRSPMVRESEFAPVMLATGSPLTQGLSGALPNLGGINLSQARTDPTVTNAMVHPAGEPLLAHWNVGLGRVAAFTSDASRWAREWIPTPTYRQFWTDLVRGVARPKSDRSQELTFEVIGNELHVRLDATGEDGKPMDLLSVPGSLYLPSGQRIPIKLSQTGSGVYEATAPAPSSGNYVVTLTPTLGSRSLSPVVGGVSRSSGVEFRRLQSNIGLLEELSRMTGGRVFSLDNPAQVKLFDRTGIRPAEARLPLWRTLLLWSVIVFMLDVGTRRVAWDRLVSREFGASLRRENRAALRDRGRQAAASLGRLRTSESEREQGREAHAAPLLTTEDAKQVVQQQADRRRAARLAKNSGAADGPSTPGSAGSGTTPAPPGSPASIESVEPPRQSPPGRAEKGRPEPEQEGGLFAAKRRAKERIDRDTQE